jgi:hypothetical protein
MPSIIEPVFAVKNILSYHWQPIMGDEWKFSEELLGLSLLVYGKGASFGKHYMGGVCTS